MTSHCTLHLYFLSGWQTHASHLVTEVAVGAGEVGRTPTRDGNLSQPLFGGNSESKQPQDHDGIAAAESVDEAVASTHPRVVLPHPDRHRHSLHVSRLIIDSRTEL